MELPNLISNVGVPTALLIALLVWVKVWLSSIQKQALEREQRLGARIDELESRDRELLMTLASDSTTAVKESYRSTRRLTSAVEGLLTALKARPCLTEDSFFPHQSIYAEHNLPRTQAPSGDTTEETSRREPKAKS